MASTLEPPGKKRFAADFVGKEEWGRLVGCILAAELKLTKLL